MQQLIFRSFLIWYSRAGDTLCCPLPYRSPAGAKLTVKEHFLRSAMLQPQPNKTAIPELFMNQGFCTVQECLKAAIQTFNLPVPDHCLCFEPSLATMATMKLCTQEGWISGIQTVQVRTTADHYKIIRETPANTLMLNYQSVLQDFSADLSVKFVERRELILVPLASADVKTTSAAPSSPVLEAELRQHVIDEINRQFPKDFFEVFEMTGRLRKNLGGSINSIKKKTLQKEVEKVRNIAVTAHKRKMQDVCMAVAKLGRRPSSFQ